MLGNVQLTWALKAVLVDYALCVPVPRACGRDQSLDPTVGAVKD